MKLKHLLATTLLSAAATAAFTPEAHAAETRRYERSVGTGDISAQWEQYGTVDLTGVTATNNLWVRTKVFGRQEPLIHLNPQAAANNIAPNPYFEFASAFLFLDGKVITATKTTCGGTDTCANATTTIEKALWSEKKSFAVVPGVTLTVTGGLNTAATLTPSARSFSGPITPGANDFRGLVSSHIDASLTLNAKLRGELDFVVASTALYGKVKIIGVSTAMATRAAVDRPGSQHYSLTASNTLSTGAGELGFDSRICIPCLTFPFFPIPVYSSFKTKLTSWGDVYSRTGNLWNVAL